ncbi:MAG: DUF2846 domain-containing protein [Deltaproteobacteria bacterium]|nr:DUF2846 domain-containing protein [Deltaproteobacteria bacterium]
MNSKTRFLFVSFAIMLLCTLGSAGFAADKTTKKVFAEAQANQALVYLIRQNKFASKMYTEYVYADDQFVAALENNSYSFVYLEPGEHLIWSNLYRANKKMHFMAGETYYLLIQDPVNILDAGKGMAWVKKVSHYTTPTLKEKQKSLAHIEKKYPKYKKKADEKSYAASVPASSQISVQAPKNKRGYVAIPARTKIHVKLLESVTSYQNKTGDQVVFEVAEDVIIENQVVINKGTRFQGIVNQASKGKMGGVAGDIDLVVSSLPAADGGLIPVLGQISSSGRDRTDKAMMNTVLFGVFGGMATGSRQGYLLKGENFFVQTRMDAWVNKKQIQPLVPAVATSFSSDAVYDGKVSKRVSFQPHKSKKIQNVSVDLSSKFKWDDLELVAVNGKVLPEPVKAQSKKFSKKKQSYVFEGWDVVKSLPIVDDEDSVFDLLFAGKSGGHVFRVKVPLELKLKAK